MITSKQIVRLVDKYSGDTEIVSILQELQRSQAYVLDISVIASHHKNRADQLESQLKDALESVKNLFEHKTEIQRQLEQTRMLFFEQLSKINQIDSDMYGRMEQEGY